MTDTDAALMQQLHDDHAAVLWGYCLRLTGHDRAGIPGLLSLSLIHN